MKGLFKNSFCYLVIAISTTLAPLAAAADYRAFELLIINQETGQERSVISTLDHIQYPKYHPLAPLETITYINTWRCWGNSSYFQPICPKPDRYPAQQKPKTEPQNLQQ